MTVGTGDNTYAFMRLKTRRLTASSSESSLPTALLDQYLQNAYFNDFPYAIKLDQMRSVYTFFTEPYRDRYPLDVNLNQGVRQPVYVEGILGTLFKDRTQFYNLWPRFPTLFQEGGTTLSGTITGVTQALPAVITSPNHNLSNGAVITINNVGGMTQLNGESYTITVVDANDFSLNGVDSTGYGAYTSGGTWIATSQTFSFVIPGPFFSREVVIGGVDPFGDPISINDDGNGNLQLLTPNPVVQVPPYPATYSATNAPPGPVSPLTGYPIPGMYNNNTTNPGLNNRENIGTVNYVSGQIDFTLPVGVSLAQATLFTVWVAQYQTGRPYCMLYWNNEITIRPVPKLIHKIEVETYLTPVQFLSTTDQPILAQWAQYLCYIAAMEILRDRQDALGVEGLREGFMRQEALVLERQGVEEIGTPSYQLFNTTFPNYVNGGWGQGYGGY